MLTLDDFDFDLPPKLIAQHPALERTASRLLHVAGGTLHDRRFADLLELVAPGDLLVFNDTRVIKARLFGHKESGGRIEVMIERVADTHHAVAMIRASKSPKPGSRIILEDTITLTVTGRTPGALGPEDFSPSGRTPRALSPEGFSPSGRTPRALPSGRTDEQGEFFALELVGDGDLWTLIEEHGRLPLPPYITHAAEGEDESRYQTVFARHPGAVAAPTAGLHFDETLLEDLRERGAELAWLTLHVGAGTFQPVRVHNLAEHRMHAERFDIPQATVDAIDRTRARGGRVIAVGTTSLRALEAGAQSGELRAGPAETEIFITPGYAFRVVDCLVTNFHLPKSTLLMLVSAFAGTDAIRAAYRHAVAERYRFFSYGDAMFLERIEQRTGQHPHAV